MEPSPLRVLLFSPRSSDATLLRKSLEGQGGFEVTVTKTIQTFRKACRSQSFSMILLDVDEVKKDIPALKESLIDGTVLPIALLSDTEDLFVKSLAIELGSWLVLLREDFDSPGLMELFHVFVQRADQRSWHHFKYQQYERIFEQLGEGAGIVDERGRVVLANQVIERMMGAGPGGLEGKALSSLLHRESFSRAIREMEKSRKGISGSYDVRPRSLEDKVLRIHATPLFSPHGEFRGSVVVGHDITESLRTQEELRKNKEHLELILRGAELGTWDINLKTGDAIRNARWSEMIGYAPGEIPSTFEAWRDLIHPDDLPAANQIVADHLAGKTDSTLIEHRMKTKSGEWKWIQSWGRVVEWDSDGTPLRAAGTHFDVDSHKRAQEDLKNSEQMLAEAQRIAHIGHWDWKVKEGLVTWSDEIYRLFGYQPGEVEPGLGRILASLPLEDGKRLRDEIDSVLQAGADGFSFEHQILLENGKFRHVHSRSSATRNEQGDVVRMIGTVQDITERKLADEYLRQSEMRFRTVWDSVVDGLILVHRDAAIEGFNPAAERMLGWSSEEVLGKPVNLLLPEPFHSRSIKEISEFISNSKEKLIGRSREIKARRKNGNTFPVELAVSEMHLGNETYYIGVLRDITERKVAEERLLRTSEELRKAYEDTARAHRAAEEANAAKSQFLANMSHEIRTPMTAILGFSKVVLERAEDHETREFMKNMVSSGEHLLDLINDVLDLSRIEAGRLTLFPEPIDLQKLVREIVVLFTPLAEEKGLSLDCSCEPFVKKVELDRQRVRQVITNLLGNAVKFTERGSVSLDVRSSKNMDGIVISVRDTGPGISPEEREKIFEPFYQSENLASRSDEGTGLGLAITMRLIQVFEGRIELDTAPGKGSVFTAHIPCRFLEVGGEVERAESPMAVLDASRTQLKILVADDHPPNRLLIDHLLSSRGHDVVMVENGQKAVEAFERESFDLLILDVQMPVMDGHEAIRQIRRLPGGDRVPIVSLTAFAMMGDREKSMEAGADDYIAKPFDPAAFVTKIESMGPASPTGRVKRTAPAPKQAEESVMEIIIDDSLKKRFLENLLVEAEAFIREEQISEEVKTWGHRIAGSGGTFGYPEITSLARAIEWGEAGDEDFLRLTLQKLIEYARSACETLSDK